MKFHLSLQAPEDAWMVHQCKNQFQILTAQSCTGSTHDLAMMKNLNIDSLAHEPWLFAARLCYWVCLHSVTYRGPVLSTGNVGPQEPVHFMCPLNEWWYLHVVCLQKKTYQSTWVDWQDT